MVSYEQTHKRCRRCERPTEHYRQATNHLLHFVITVVTCGWWALVWLLLSFKIGGWKCRECGTGAFLPKLIGGTVAVIGLAVTGLIVLGAMQGGGDRRQPPSEPAPLTPVGSAEIEAAPSDPQEPAAPPETTATAAEPPAAAPIEPAPPAAPPETPAPAEEAKPEEYSVFSAAQVYAYYDENEIRGDEELKGKRFAVKGKISDINKDIFGTPFIAFRSNDWIFGVQCMFPRSSTSALTKLTPGDFITIAGKCSGKLGNVIMSDCRFYTPPAPEPTPPQPRWQPTPPKPKLVARTWTDATGKFSIEAEFAGYSAGNVKLRKADDTILELPFDRLSEADKKWIEDRRKN